MRKFLTSLMLLVFFAPTILKADGLNLIRQNSDDTRNHNTKDDTFVPVYDVKANEIDDNNVKVCWSWNEILPDKLLINFENGDLNQAGFNNEVSEYPWEITENAYEGTYAIKSTNEGEGYSTSAIEITVDVPYNGVMGFYNRISSETEYDVACFYIDGVKMLETSGIKPWGYREYEISEGTHTYRWEYTKDYNMDQGEDAFYLDNIKLFGEVEPSEGGWIHYDDGEYVESVSPGASSPMHWAIKFPRTESYAGLTLTKVSIYDALPDFAGTYTANIYLGGDDAPATLVSTQSANLTGVRDFVEISLSNPVVLDGTQPLWISFYTENIFAPASACAYADDPNSDWLSFDGTNWKHVFSDPNLRYSWMIRGFLENSKGETIVLENEDNQVKNNEFKSYKLYRYDYFAGEISDETVEVVAENITDTLFIDNSWASLEDGTYQWGVAAVYENINTNSKNYSFQNDNESTIVWSNNVDKNMLTQVNVNVTTNNGMTAEGTVVKFVNVSEPEMGYDYEIVLDETGSYSWERFRKGTYELTISKDTYNSCADGEVLEIWDAETVDCLLEEIVYAVGDLYVSPTGWAMWTIYDDKSTDRNVISYDVYLDGSLEEEVTTPYYQHSDLVVGQSYTTSVVANYATGESESLSYTWTNKGCDNYEGITDLNAKYVNGKAIVTWNVPGIDLSDDIVTLSYGFENNMNGWTTIDANDDGHYWYHSSENGDHAIEMGAPHSGTGYICSESFCNAMGILTPNDYVIAPVKIVATETSKIKFWASARDMIYAADHFGVAVSTESNTSDSDFTTIAEWTMTAKSGDKRERDSKEQGGWYQYEADLSYYADQEIWVALRHFKSVDMYMLMVDDVELIDVINVAERKDEAQCIGAMVYRDGELLTPEPIRTGRFSEPMQVGTEREYCVVAVHDGEMDESYYAMSCPECITYTAQIACNAPKDLYGVQSANDNDKAGVRLVWPYTAPTTNWLYYDNGIVVDAIGGPDAFSWAVMFPAASLIGYEGTSLTKITMNDPDAAVGASEGMINIYSGGATSPGTLVYSQPYSLTAIGDFVDFELTSSVPLDVNKNLWIVLTSNQGFNYPAAVTADCGNANARWISMDGSTWEDMKVYNLEYSWTIRGFVEENGKGERELTSLDHYNIYRGTSADDFEFVAESKEGTYFETIEDGTYYYQVTAVYKEDGVECESDPATAYENEEQNYVVVEVSTVSIDENTITGLVIYPNPTKDVLNISADAMSRISIINTLGQIVYDQEVNSDNAVVNVANYETGIYMLQITTEKGVIVKRISVVK